MTKVAGIGLALAGSTIACKGLSQDTIYENYKPQELIYMSLKDLYKK
ncbi:MAG: hypothetical protein QXP77_00935 [Candidatus Aenigmatarchaeota archaeon]